MPSNFNKISFDEILAFCILSPNNQTRENQYLKQQKILPQLKNFPAIIGKNLSKLELKNYLKEGILDKLSICLNLSGEIGCYLSHLTVLQEFLNSDKKYCLVLEDDADLKENFKTLALEAINECPNNFDLLYFYGRLRDEKTQNTPIIGKKHILKSGELWGTVAYLVHKKGASKIIQNIKPMGLTAIDNHFNRMVRSHKINAFITKTSFVYTLGGYNEGAIEGLVSTNVHNSPFIKKYFIWQYVITFFYSCYFYLFFMPLRIFYSFNLKYAVHGLKFQSYLKIKMIIKKKLS